MLANNNNFCQGHKQCATSKTLPGEDNHWILSHPLNGHLYILLFSLICITALNYIISWPQGIPLCYLQRFSLGFLCTQSIK